MSSPMTLIDLQGHFSLSKNKWRLLFRSTIESPDNLMNDDVVDNLD